MVDSGDANQKILYHGSPHARAIALEGFKIGHSKGGYFGRGLYFCDLASKANQYCSADADASCPKHPRLCSCYKCMRIMLLVKVVLGRTCFKTKQENLKEAPTGYHSVTGIPAPEKLWFTEYVVYDKSQMEKKVEDVQISIPHVAQKYTWDCGLACAQMILSYCEKPFEDFGDVCQQFEFNTRLHYWLECITCVWTIDLARLLTHYSVKHNYVTVTFGVDKEYSKKSFYKERFDKDQKRVDNLFNDADVLGLSVRKGSVEIEEIVEHLLTLCPLVALVDANLLKCLWCNSLVSCACLGQCLGGLGGYQGHYIVVCGFNSKQKVFYYQNPARSNNELCCCTMKVFDRARMAHGTDQDLIFIQHRKKDES